MLAITKTLNNHSGVILITVLMLTFVLTIVALGILGLYVSQVKTAQSVVDTIKSEQLAVGSSYREYMCQEWQSCGPQLLPETLNGKIFTLSRTALAVTPEGIKPYQIRVDYP